MDMFSRPQRVPHRHLQARHSQCARPRIAARQIGNSQRTHASVFGELFERVVAVATKDIGSQVLNDLVGWLQLGQATVRPAGVQLLRGLTWIGVVVGRAFTLNAGASQVFRHARRRWRK